MDTLKNSTAILTDFKIISPQKEGSKNGVKVTAPEIKLKEMEERISLFLKSKYASSVKGIINGGRGSVTLDFPFLSKL